MNIVLTVIIVLVVLKALNEFVKKPSRQLWIRPWGFNKIPKLVLELAKVKQGNDVTYKDLSGDDKEKISKVQEKLDDILSIRLTFLDRDNLIHIQQTNRSYFFATDKTQRELVREELGKLDKDIHVEFVLTRRKLGRFSSSVLVGYLIKKGEFFSPKDKEETEILFEFPESLINASFFTEGSAKRFGLKKFSDADMHKNELGDEEGFYVVTYDLEGKKVNIKFQLEP